MIFSSDYDIIKEPARSIIVILTIIMVIGAIIIGLYAILASKKPDRKLSSNYFFGIAIFTILFGIGRLIYMIHDYFVPDYIDSIEMDVFLWRVATVIIFSGFIFAIYTIETFVYTKTKRIFTIIGIFILIMVLILERDTARLFLYAGYLILLMVPFFIYLNIVKNATGVVRKRAIIILIGFVFIFLGQGTALFELIGLMDRVSSSIFAPPVTLVGLAVTIYGFISMSR